MKLLKPLTILVMAFVVSCAIPVNREATVSINAAAPQQVIRGFGAANIIGWRPDLTAADRITAFSVADGLGFSVLRVRVSPNIVDWDANQATIDAAKANGALVIASAWSAPASMKDNNDLIGGKLKATSHAEYAAHLSAFCTAVDGVDAISPINEPNITVPYESMLMSASEVAAFVAAQGGNCGAPIMAPEPFNMSQSYINSYLATASANTTYVAGHIYGATPYTVSAGGKEVWMTEHYIDSSTSSGDGNNWNKALNVAKEIHDCMRAGYSMYVWWYIKRFYGPIDESVDGIPTKTGYVMSQYAKYVRPGAYRVTATSPVLTNVHTTAYTKNGKVIIVVVNKDEFACKLTLNISGMSPTLLTPYVTSSAFNCVQESDIVVAAGTATVSVYAGSIMTFVSN